MLGEMQKPGIAVLDFGSQYTQLIARRFRDIGVYSEIFEPGVAMKDIELAIGIVSSGGSASVYKNGSPRCRDGVWEMPVPKLAICYSFQAYAHDFGGQTTPAENSREFGKAEIIIEKSEPLFNDLDERQIVWMSHGDEVSRLPPSMHRLAYTEDCKYAAAWDPNRRIVGVQFHPEVNDTLHGMDMLSNFLSLTERKF